MGRRCLGLKRARQVAFCRTGYYLSCYPEVERAGLDLSPAMLEIARRKNPDTPLIEGNFKDRSLVEAGKWDVITSMWWAYGLVESVADIEDLVANLHHWLAEDGVCFVPICNPGRNLHAGRHEVPYVATENAAVCGGGSW